MRYHIAYLIISHVKILILCKAIKSFFSSLEDKVTVHFINRDGDKLTAHGKIGDSLLDVVVDNNLDIDGFGKLKLLNFLHLIVFCKSLL